MSTEKARHKELGINVQLAKEHSCFLHVKRVDFADELSVQVSPNRRVDPNLSRNTLGE